MSEVYQNECLNESSRHCWIGDKKPFPYFQNVSEIFDEKFLFRSNSKHHGIYTNILSHEYDLGKFKQWPLILDEILRLAHYSRDSIISIRYTQTHFLTCFQLKSFLYRRLGSACSIVSEDTWDDGVAILKIKISSMNKKIDRTWTFGVIYDGSKVENLIRFIESIRRQQGISKYEILICGPSSEKLIGNDIKVLTFEEKFLDKGWITEKKNFIIQNSKYENICLVHNRYELNDDFLEGFERFGYDFDVVVVKQVDAKNNRFPDWVTVGQDWDWTRPGLLEPQDYSPYLYMNGGMIIGKRAVLLDNLLNPLLFWNQAEDVEFTRRLAFRGFVPRYNTLSIAKVIESRAGYTQSFQPVKYYKENYTFPLSFARTHDLLVIDDLSFKILKVGLFNKVSTRVLRFLKHRSGSLKLKLQPLYQKFKPYISRYKFLSNLVSSLRARIGI